MSQSYRVEKDSLGEMQVPADALYAAQTQRAVLNFPISGMRPYPAFVWAMATIKRAAAEVNQDLGLLDTGLAKAIEPSLGDGLGDQDSCHRARLEATWQTVCQGWRSLTIADHR